MVTVSKTSLSLATAVCLLAATTARANAHINTHDNGRIVIKGTEILITAGDGSRAEIDPAGDLKIRDRAVPVTDAQRQLLVQYSQDLRNLEKRSQDAFGQAWRMAPSILGAALSALFTGGSEKQINDDASAAAKPLKDQVMQLCDGVKTQLKVQDQISDVLPAFKPYAVISAHDTEHNCHSDDEDKS